MGRGEGISAVAAAGGVACTAPGSFARGHCLTGIAATLVPLPPTWGAGRLCDARGGAGL